MKKTIIWLCAAILLTSFVSCGGRRNAKQAEAQAPEAEATEVCEAAEAQAETCFTAIDKYLTDEIGKQYAAGEITIPFHNFVDVDETNADDIVVLGDFWVFNYNQSGDTLKTVSGGNHPGKMHVKKTEDGHFEVIAFEPVADGADNLKSAQSLFGDKFDAFQAAQADQDKREALRKEAVAAYAKCHDLAVSLLQDYGWPAVEIAAE